jgi:hypothetical protein
MSDSSSFLDNYLGNDGGSLRSSFGDRGDYFSGLRGQVFGGQLGASEAMNMMQLYGLQKGDMSSVFGDSSYQDLLSYRPSEADYSNMVRTAFATNLGMDPGRSDIGKYSRLLSASNPGSPGEAQSQLSSMLANTPEFQKRYLTPEMSANQAKYGMAARDNKGNLTGGYVNATSKAMFEGRSIDPYKINVKPEPKTKADYRHKG